MPRGERRREEPRAEEEHVTDRKCSEPLQVASLLERYILYSVPQEPIRQEMMGVEGVRERERRRISSAIIMEWQAEQ